MAALAQNPLSHAKPLRRDRIREKVLNYLTKLTTGTAKVPTSQRKPDRRNISPKATEPDILYMEEAAGGSGQDHLKSSLPLTTTLSEGNHYSLNDDRVLILNTHCTKNDFLCSFHFLSNFVLVFTSCHRKTP